MATSQRFFRNLWRVNAVLILLAAGSAIIGVGVALVSEFGSRTAREPDTGIPVAAPEANVHPRLGHAEVVPGTSVMRATLTVERDGSGFGKGSGYGSSGGSTETRNILFIEGSEKAARWLFPDNVHIIEGTIDVTDEANKNTIATVVLVKPSATPSEVGPERLPLFGPSGKKVVEVASDATDVHLAKVSSGELTVLFERNRRMVVATFDAKSIGEAFRTRDRCPATQVRADADSLACKSRSIRRRFANKCFAANVPSRSCEEIDRGTP
jgi:hypothetical protein